MKKTLGFFLLICSTSILYGIFRVSYPSNSTNIASIRTSSKDEKLKNGKHYKDHGNKNHSKHKKNFDHHHKKYPKKFIPPIYYTYAPYGIYDFYNPYYARLGAYSSIGASPRQCFHQCSDTCFRECTERGGWAFECRKNCKTKCAQECNYEGYIY